MHTLSSAWPRPHNMVSMLSIEAQRPQEPEGTRACHGFSEARPGLGLMLRE